VRQRLRPAHSPEALAEIYAKPHDSTRWNDHIVRVDVTRALVKGLLRVDVPEGSNDPPTVADLSCGNGRIASNLGVRNVILGDFAPGYAHTGPIEKTIDEIDPVDVFICSETIEHLDDPDAVLRKIRQKARHLVLSTPIEAWDETNPEHYWAWDREEVEVMLFRAGFPSLAPYVELDMRNAWSPYCFGIWVAS
jgi:hypothetical protein